MSDALDRLLAIAREQGRNEALAVVRKYLPASEADFIASVVTGPTREGGPDVPPFTPSLIASAASRPTSGRESGVSG